MTDPIGEIDLTAYVDGELDDERSAQVEAYLADNPACAAQVMRDLHIKRVLRLNIRGGTGGITTPEMMANARRLDRSLSGRSRGIPSRALMAALVVAAIVPLSVTRLGQDNAASAKPSYLDDAVRAHRAVVVRERMQSQPEAPRLDAEEILRTIRIRVPRLPDGWEVKDAQIMPSAQGPALLTSITTRDGADLFLFAVYASSTAPAEPIAIQHDGVNIAYWQEAHTSYAVIGDASVGELDRIADDLEDNDLV